MDTAELLAQTFPQQCQGRLQPFSKLFVSASNFGYQSLDRNPKGSRQLCGSNLPHESPLESSRHFSWQSIHPATVDGRKAMPKTSQRQSMIPDTADHILGLP